MVNIKKSLLVLARRQGGYFTSTQARDLGYGHDLQSYHCKAENWQRVSRGLYRLTGYDDTMLSDFSRWYLWAGNKSRNALVAVSHLSALAYYGLHDYYPEVVHLTVSSTRRNYPAEGCITHWNKLEDEDIIEKPGFYITSPIRTLKDLKPDLVYSGKWQRVTMKALQMQIISDNEFEMLSGKKLSDDFQAQRLCASQEALTGEGSSIEKDSTFSYTFRMSSPWRETGFKSRAGGSFTLVEMLVVIAIIAIMASMLAPSLQNAIGTASSMQCINNERQVGIAFMNYVNSYNGFMPLVNAWSSGIAPYDWLGSLGQFLKEGIPAVPTSDQKKSYIMHLQCPVQTSRFIELGGDSKKEMASYGMNGYLGLSDVTSEWKKISQVNKPSNTISISEGGWWGAYQLAQQLNGYYMEKAIEIHDGVGVHHGKINILWCDGSVKSWYDAKKLTLPPYTSSSSENVWYVR